MQVRTALMCYLAIAGFIFLAGVFVGKVLKKDVLHGKVMLGIMNSALLAIAWPVAIVLCIIGWLYDAIQAWKKL